MVAVESKDARDAICRHLKRAPARRSYDAESTIRASLTAHQRNTRSQVYEHLNKINFPMEKISFSADVMELWTDTGRAIRIDLSLPSDAVA